MVDVLGTVIQGVFLTYVLGVAVVITLGVMSERYRHMMVIIDPYHLLRVALMWPLEHANRLRNR